MRNKRRVATPDFSEPHPYSNIEKKDGYNITNMLNRVKGQLYWLGKNCPIPWIEGETGFRSSDT